MLSNVQIIQRVITHHTICFYSQNTLFLKVSVHQLIPFIYFQLFYVNTICILKNTLHKQAKMNCTMCNYTPYNLYMDVPSHKDKGKRPQGIGKTKCCTKVFTCETKNRTSLTFSIMFWRKINPEKRVLFWGNLNY